MTEEKETLIGSLIRKIIKVDVKVSIDDEFMRCGGSKREKKLNSPRKTETGFDNVEDE